jgi:hypothetical protein
LSRVYYLTNARTGTSFLIQRAFETFFVGALSQPIVAKQPPFGPGWAHELKHDGFEGARNAVLTIQTRSIFPSPSPR